MTKEDKEGSMATRCIHAGDERDEQGAIHTPLYNHSTFAFPDTEAVLDVVEGRTEGNLYTRYGFNPTLKSVEKKIASIEGGEGALVFGMNIPTTMSHLRPILSDQAPVNSCPMPQTAG